MEFPKIEIKLEDIFPRLAKIGKFIGHLLTGPSVFASHGDHLFEHPLDSPIEPVTDWPEYEQGKLQI